MKEPNLRASDWVQASMKSRLYWGMEVDIVSGSVCLYVTVLVVVDSFFRMKWRRGGLVEGHSGASIATVDFCSPLLGQKHYDCVCERSFTPPSFCPTDLVYLYAACAGRSLGKEEIFWLI